MPIYEYECKKCGHQSELWQKISDSLVPECECCKGKMKRLISQNTFHLKGTGWYVTDYASNKNTDTGNKKTKTTSDKDKSKAKEAKSSDKKPAKKAPSAGESK